MFEGAYIRNHFSVSILMSLYTAEGGGGEGAYIRSFTVC